MALISLCLTACSSRLDVYRCGSDTDCDSDDGSGLCESNELCSFANPNCPGERAYGEAAGELSGSCVASDSSLIDASSVVDGGADASSLPSCADEDLGSALGAAVATGTTMGAGDDQSQCEGAGGGDDVFSWTAPAEGDYLFDLCGSNGDLVLYLRAATCTGLTLACNDDSDDSACGNLNPRFSRTFNEGEMVVIVVDAIDEGSYILNITQL